MMALIPCVQRSYLRDVVCIYDISCLNHSYALEARICYVLHGINLSQMFLTGISSAFHSAFHRKCLTG